MPANTLSPSELAEVLDSLSDAICLIDQERDWEITYVNRSAAAFWQSSSDDLVGQSLWDLFSDARGSELYHKIREAVDRGSASEFEARAPGQQRWLRLRVHPAAKAVLLSFNDISHDRQSKIRLQAEHAVTHVLAEGLSIEEAAPTIIDAICSGLEAMCGSLWLPEGDKLICVELRGPSDSVTFADFAEASQNMHFHKGEGLPGRVWKTGSAHSIPQLADDENFPRAQLAAAAALQSGFAFPISTGSEFFGVLEFFTHHRADLSESTLEMMDSIGSEIGQSIRRWRAEQNIRAAELRHRAVLESSLDAIVTMNRDGLINEFNPAAEQIFGFRREEVLGKPLADYIIPQEYRQAHWEGLEHFLDTGEGPALRSRLELPALRSDGTTFPSELTITHQTLPDGEQLFTGYLRDITARKYFEGQLIEAKNQAEEAGRLKASMLRNMSHEIRTPLTSLLAWTSMLQEIDQDDARFAKGIATIERSAKRLTETLDSVLTMAQLEGATLEPSFEPVVIGEVTAELVDEFEPMAAEKGLWLREFSEAPSALACLDSTLFRRILTNLISNAIKFTDSGGVNVSVLDHGEQIAVRVHDTGIGISKEFLPQLFEEFYQESVGYSRRYEGTGLGLAICKRLTEAMEGTISVASTPGRGSTFTVTFPRLEADAQSDEEGSPLEKTSTTTADRPTEVEPLRSGTDRASILLVEDTQSIRELVSDTLGQFANVWKFHDAEAALECARERTFDLILMDIGLPGLSGIEATKQLRQMEGYTNKPIIALTGHVLPDDVERIMEAPFSGHISKPFSIEALTEEVTARLQDSA